MDFKGFIGQREITEGLKNAIMQDRVGHAYIFKGPAGIGKRTLAGIFSGLLLCGNAAEPVKTCDTCMACRLYKNGTNPDFYELDSGGASIGIDEIREIQNFVTVKPLYSKKKVYLINRADKMTVQAQNGLLKLLEEPPGYAVLILTAINTEALLETIRSRSLKLVFRNNTEEEVKKYLVENKIDERISHDFIARYSGGVIGEAIELAESPDFINLREEVLRMVTGLPGMSLIKSLDYIRFFEENKEEADRVFDLMTLFFRDLLVLKTSGSENMLINSDKKDIIFNNVSKYTAEGLVRSIELVAATRRHLKHNANFQLTIEVMLMKMQEELC